MYRNDLQKKMELKQKKIDAGLVLESYPNVSNIVILMTYYQKSSDAVFMVRTVNVFPESYAYFHMQCTMKECVEGGFDLAPIIAGMIKGRKKKGRGKLVCRGKGADLPAEHASITYEISIQYSRRVR
jgi:hypothetical protein